MVDTGSILALEYEMGVLTRRLRRRIAERARLVHPELSPMAYSILMALNESGPQRASDLVELFGIDKGAVSRQVQQLLELELVERRPDPADRRAQILTVADMGRARLSDVAARRREELGARLGEWTNGDLQGFVDMLSRYNTSVADGA